jgi:glutathione synthase/RimK-type ligase-like ATP-grasp enzyme
VSAAPAAVGRRIGFVTCRAWPAISESDAGVARALAGRGVRVEPLAWNEAGADPARFDGLVLRSCWDYHDAPEAFLAWIGRLEAAGARVWNSPAMVRWNLDKRYLLSLGDKGVPIPETVILADDGADLAAAMDERGWRRAVVKPLVSASAHGATLVERQRVDEVVAILAAGAIRRPVMLQPFLDEIATRGEWSVVVIDGEPTHAVLKHPAPHDFRVQPRLGGRAEPAEPPAPVLTAARRALALAGGEPLYARVDLVETDRDVLLMELELIEPGLFFTGAPAAAARLADAVLRRLGPA